MSREEDHIVSSLVDLCKRLNVKTLVQIGAEDGYEANAIREATGCRAVCIDADYKCRPTSESIEWHYAMIGATNGTAPFYVHTTSGLSSPIVRGDSHEEMHEWQMRRLDTFCTENGISPDALVIDTEGTTLDVLEGAGQLLDGVKVVYAEVQAYPLRPGMRTVKEVDEYLGVRGLTVHRGLPSYDGGAQSNLTWVRP